MSFKLPFNFRGVVIENAIYKIIERNAHDGEKRGRIVAAIFPSETDKDAYKNILDFVAWDIQKDAQYDEYNENICTSPAYDDIFGKYEDANQKDSRKEMYLWIRSLDNYKDALDLL